MLALEDVYAGYGGGDVLRGVTFTVEQGSLTCIVGPNGAGKSTLLAVISGLLRPRAGTVTFQGRSIAGLSPRRVLTAGIVQVLQGRSLFPDMTVRENVEMGGFLVRDAALVRRRYQEIAAQFPVVAERAKDKAGALSGGQQRLVEFARSLMLDPSLVILDEPSTGLEPRFARAMYRMIRQMNQAGRTILLVEQNVRAGLGLATNGVVLEAGRVRLTGSGKSILDNPQISALYLGGTLEQAAGAAVGAGSTGPAET